MNRMDYDIVIRPLPEEKGGGYIALVPDLQGCMSDGETPDEALTNVRDAMAEWLDLHARLARPIPAPGTQAARMKEEREALRRTIHLLSGDLASRLGDVEAKMGELQSLLEKFERLFEAGQAVPYDHAPDHGQRLEACH